MIVGVPLASYGRYYLDIVDRGVNNILIFIGAAALILSRQAGRQT